MIKDLNPSVMKYPQQGLYVQVTRRHRLVNHDVCYFDLTAA